MDGGTDEQSGRSATAKTERNKSEQRAHMHRNDARRQTYAICARVVHNDDDVSETHHINVWVMTHLKLG